METQQIWPMTANPITIRAAAALALAGVWDTPLEIAVAGIDNIMFYITYTRSAAGGAFDFQLFVSPYSADVGGVQSWFCHSLYAAGVLAAGADAQSRIQCEYITYQSTAAGAETFVYGPIEFARTVERIRVRARESGVVGTPGALHIVAVGV